MPNQLRVRLQNAATEYEGFCRDNAMEGYINYSDEFSQRNTVERRQLERRQLLRRGASREHVGVDHQPQE